MNLKFAITRKRKAGRRKLSEKEQKKEYIHVYNIYIQPNAQSGGLRCLNEVLSNQQVSQPELLYILQHTHIGAFIYTQGLASSSSPCGNQFKFIMKRTHGIIYIQEKKGREFHIKNKTREGEEKDNRTSARKSYIVLIATNHQAWRE